MDHVSIFSKFHAAGLVFATLLHCCTCRTWNTTWFNNYLWNDHMTHPRSNAYGVVAPSLESLFSDSRVGVPNPYLTPPCVYL